MGDHGWAPQEGVEPLPEAMACEVPRSRPPPGPQQVIEQMSKELEAQRVETAGLRRSLALAEAEVRHEKALAGYYRREFEREFLAAEERRGG